MGEKHYFLFKFLFYETMVSLQDVVNPGTTRVCVPDSLITSSGIAGVNQVKIKGINNKAAADMMNVYVAGCIGKYIWVEAAGTAFNHSH